jgi:rare lipoprotein A (peptidoglycan hydrolase)
VSTRRGMVRTVGPMKLRSLALSCVPAAALMVEGCASTSLGTWQAASPRHHDLFRPAHPLEGGTGLASYYGGARTADVLTAAHRTLPFGTRVRVTNLSNNRAVTVEITDRGPFVANRLIDLSYGAAAAIGMTESGLARVRLDVLP